MWHTLSRGTCESQLCGVAYRMSVRMRGSTSPSTTKPGRGGGPVGDADGGPVGDGCGTGGVGAGRGSGRPQAPNSVPAARSAATSRAARRRGGGGRRARRRVGAAPGHVRADLRTRPVYQPATGSGAASASPVRCAARNRSAAASSSIPPASWPL